MVPSNLLSPVSKSQLKPGDIFLCVFEQPDIWGYLDALTTIIKQATIGGVDPEALKKAEGTILRALITAFDRDIYSHASFWNGHHIVEAGSKGVRKSDLSSYKNYLTHVYRFQKQGETLGSKHLPASPLLEKADAIVQKHLSYSYDTAYLMIFLCITRWRREQWIAQMESFLKAHLKEISPQVIDLIFEKNHDALVRSFEWLADEMIRLFVKFKNDDGLVCSQTVAAIFNEATPAGKYHIEKPLTIAVEIQSSEKFELMKTTNHPETILLVDKLTKLLSSYPKFQASTNSIPWPQAIDIIYTPHDIARSKNTTIAGFLQL